MAQSTLEACASCRFSAPPYYQANDLVDEKRGAVLQCRRRAPKPQFASVYETDWCGDFERKLPSPAYITPNHVGRRAVCRLKDGNLVGVICGTTSHVIFLRVPAHPAGVTEVGVDRSLVELIETQPSQPVVPPTYTHPSE